MNFDGLITDYKPAVQVRGGVLRKATGKAVTMKRGTVLAEVFRHRRGRQAGGYLGTAAGSNETLTPDCILCDDIEVGAENDEPVAVYTAGCFDPEKVTVADEYTITESDKDALRMRGIVFKAASPAN